MKKLMSKIHLPFARVVFLKVFKKKSKTELTIPHFTIYPNKNCADILHKKIK